MLKHGLTESMVVRGTSASTSTPATSSSEEDRAKLQNLVNDIASQAHAHLARARELSGKGQLPKDAAYALMPGIGAGMYLEALQKHDFVIYPDSEAPLQHVKLQMNLLQYMFRRKL